jgi:hypothetical protein
VLAPATTISARVAIRGRMEADSRKHLQIQAEMRNASPRHRGAAVKSPAHQSWWGRSGGSPFSPLDELPKWAGVNDLRL